MGWAALLIIGTLMTFLLPFIPSFLEWKRKTDAFPLRVNSQDKTLMDYKIRLWYEYIAKNFSEHISRSNLSKSNESGVLEDGAQFLLESTSGKLHLTLDEISSSKVDRILILLATQHLPERFHFTDGVYCTEALTVGAHTHLVTLLADKDIVIQEHCVIQELVCSAQRLILSEYVNVNGYAKAQEIVLKGENQFQCLYAQKIYFGLHQKDTTQVNAWATEIVAPQDRKRLVIRDQHAILEAEKIFEDLIVHGNLTVHSNATILSNIKCHKKILLGNNVKIKGALISEGDIYIGDDCIIEGPIVAKGMITIGQHCQIGGVMQSSSVIAQQIIVGTGTLLFGLLLAKIHGVLGKD